MLWSSLKKRCGLFFKATSELLMKSNGIVNRHEASTRKAPEPIQVRSRDIFVWLLHGWDVKHLSLGHFTDRHDSFYRSFTYIQSNELYRYLPSSSCVCLLPLCWFAPKAILQSLVPRHAQLKRWLLELPPGSDERTNCRLFCKEIGQIYHDDDGQETPEVDDAIGNFGSHTFKLNKEIVNQRTNYVAPQLYVTQSSSPCHFQMGQAKCFILQLFQFEFNSIKSKSTTAGVAKMSVKRVKVVSQQAFPVIHSFFGWNNLTSFKDDLVFPVVIPNTWEKIKFSM